MSWPLVHFKDVAQIVTGSTPKKIDGNYDGDVPFVTPGDLGIKAVISSSKTTVTEQGAKSGRLLTKGSVMVCCIGATIGKVGIADRNVISNQQINSLIFDESMVFPKYGYYFCTTLKPLLVARSSSTTMPIVNKTNFSEFEMPLPPLDEQKRIAAILDKADAIRRKRQQAIQLADDFLRSVFLDMFGDPVSNPKGWEKVSMADFGTFKNGLNFGRGESGNSLHCLGVGNFKSLDRIEDVSALPKVELNKLPAEDYFLKNDDLVFVRSNGNKALVGRCITMHPGEEKVTFSGFCIRYRIENIKLDANFLNLCLRIPSMKNEMLQGGQGANIQNINQQLLANLNIPLPPIEQQKRFSDLVATFRLLLTKKQNSLKSGSELFNSLSQKAFAGEL